ncbi:MAG: GGDEF domain-containing protein [Marivibrio sp.]|uniref:GGDEF domain-containing protein n=1 Tax=Marivibrio sp. TaxID=2039719 RepID=UPI0032EE91EC
MDNRAVKAEPADDQETFLAALNAGVRYAFQPIVNIQTGAVFGYEALLRHHEAVGVSSIAALFDRAHGLGVLHRADIILRERAIAQFAKLPHAERTLLFFNLDGRIFESQDYHPHQTVALLSHHGVSPHALCLELSERYDNASARHLNETLRVCREHDYKLAIDDFGRGFSEMKMLYDHQPDFVKIDRYFISGIEDDSKKRLMVSTIVNLAHVLGTRVVAEGVETAEEFLACKDAGCDLVQGYYVARPTQEMSDLRETYAAVEEANQRDRRRKQTDSLLVRDHVAALESLDADQSVTEMLEAFRAHKEQTLFPLLDPAGRPLGVVRETDVKDFVYLQYGRDLLQNKAYAKRLTQFARRCPIADVQCSVERILEIYAIAGESDGVMITEGDRYLGFLTADRLLRLVNEKNIAAARDENPLSNLPGNNSIDAYIATALETAAGDYTLLYFDLNDFKPFNDTYGFRQGDRVIVLFAELLRRSFRDGSGFIAHVGGDDFFAALEGVPHEEAQHRARQLMQRFKSDVESFYSAEHRAAGGFSARDREGRLARYGLLSACCAAIHLPGHAPRPSLDRLMRRFADLKKAAKRGRDPLAAETLKG